MLKDHDEHKMQSHHDKAVPLKETKEETAPVQKPVEKAPEKNREHNLEEALVYLRDNVLHGNDAHVKRINSALVSPK